MPISEQIREKILLWIKEQVPYEVIISRVKKEGESISKGGITYLKQKYLHLQIKLKRIYYFEYLDHGKTYQSPQIIFEHPFTLWCVGIIVDESKDFLAIRCSGIKGKIDNSPPSFEIIFKKAISKQKLIYEI